MCVCVWCGECVCVCGERCLHAHLLQVVMEGEALAQSGRHSASWEYPETDVATHPDDAAGGPRMTPCPSSDSLTQQAELPVFLCGEQTRTSSPAPSPAIVEGTGEVEEEDGCGGCEDALFMVRVSTAHTEDLEQEAREGARSTELAAAGSDEATELAAAGSDEATELTAAGSDEATEITAAGSDEATELTAAGSDEATELTAAGSDETTELAAAGSDETTELAAAGSDEATELTAAGSDETTELAAAGSDEATELAAAGSDEATELAAAGSDEATELAAAGSDEATELAAAGSDEATELAAAGSDEATELAAAGSDEATELAVAGSDEATELAAAGSDETTELAVAGSDDTALVTAVLAPGDSEQSRVVDALELGPSGLHDMESEEGSNKELSDSMDNPLEDSGDFPSLSSMVGSVSSDTSTPASQTPRDEDVTAEGWRTRRKHVFVLSEAGKPIYSRYGNEEALSSTMGVMMALVSFVQSGNNSIRSISSDNQKVVFLQQGPLVLVSVSRAPQSEEQLRQELHYVYYQIISMLTRASVTRIFERKKNYDLRRLLAGSEKILDSLLDLLDSDLGFLLGAVRSVALSCPLRDSLSAILTKAITPNLVFSILVAEQQLVTIVQERAIIEDCRLDPADLHLLLNLIGASSAFQAGEIWTPICLPRFNPDGYFYAYISYLDAECTVCLVLLSTDKESFYAVSDCKKKIQEAMEANRYMQALAAACRCSPYSASSLGIPELLHFVYMPMDVPDTFKQLPQFTSPVPDGPYSTEAERQRLFDLYRYLHCRIHSSTRPLRLVYQVAQKETLLAWVTSKFELYAAFSSLVTKVGAINVITKLLRWIKKEEDRLFIRYPPKYSTTPLPGKGARTPRPDRTEPFQNGLFSGL
uniref:Vacuolar fusion protein MON1 homolog n=1 Tax=Leptobrachium leishanense TaxID=445787 RepID=A0A8C5PU91_9ANUR